MAARNVTRNLQIWQDHCRGTSREELVERYGLSPARISQILTAQRNAIPVETRAEMIKREEALLLRLRDEALRLWYSDPAPAYSGGKPVMVTGPDGIERHVDDHSGRLQALAAAMAITKRIADMFGLDAPKEAHLTVEAPALAPQVEEKIRAARAAVEARHAVITGEVVEDAS